MLIHKDMKLSTQKLKTLISDKNNSFGNEIFYKNRMSDEEFFEGSNRLVLKSDSHFDTGELLLSLFEQLRGLAAGTTITLNQHSLKQEIIKQINHIAITNQQYFNAEFSQAFHLWEKNKNFTNMQEIETIVSILQNSLKKKFVENKFQKMQNVFHTLKRQNDNTIFTACFFSDFHKKNWSQTIAKQNQFSFLYNDLNKQYFLYELHEKTKKKQYFFHKIYRKIGQKQYFPKNLYQTESFSFQNFQATKSEHFKQHYLFNKWELFEGRYRIYKNIVQVKNNQLHYLNELDKIVFQSNNHWLKKFFLFYRTVFQMKKMKYDKEKKYFYNEANSYSLQNSRKKDLFYLKNNFYKFKNKKVDENYNTDINFSSHIFSKLYFNPYYDLIHTFFSETLWYKLKELKYQHPYEKKYWNDYNSNYFFNWNYNDKRNAVYIKEHFYHVNNRKNNYKSIGFLNSLFLKNNIWLLNKKYHNENTSFLQNQLQSFYEKQNLQIFKNFEVKQYKNVEEKYNNENTHFLERLNFFRRQNQLFFFKNVSFLENRLQSFYEKQNSHVFKNFEFKQYKKVKEKYNNENTHFLERLNFFRRRNQLFFFKNVSFLENWLQSFYEKQNSQVFKNLEFEQYKNVKEKYNNENIHFSERLNFFRRQDQLFFFKNVSFLENRLQSFYEKQNSHVFKNFEFKQYKNTKEKYDNEKSYFLETLNFFIQRNQTQLFYSKNTNFLKKQLQFFYKKINLRMFENFDTKYYKNLKGVSYLEYTLQLLKSNRYWKQNKYLKFFNNSKIFSKNKLDIFKNKNFQIQNNIYFNENPLSFFEKYNTPLENKFYWKLFSLEQEEKFSYLWKSEHKLLPFYLFPEKIQKRIYEVINTWNFNDKKKKNTFFNRQKMISRIFEKNFYHLEIERAHALKVFQNLEKNLGNEINSLDFNDSINYSAFFTKKNDYHFRYRNSKIFKNLFPFWSTMFFTIYKHKNLFSKYKQLEKEKKSFEQKTSFFNQNFSYVFSSYLLENQFSFEKDKNEYINSIFMNEFREIKGRTYFQTFFNSTRLNFKNKQKFLQMKLFEKIRNSFFYLLKNKQQHFDKNNQQNLFFDLNKNFKNKIVQKENFYYRAKNDNFQYFEAIADENFYHLQTYKNLENEIFDFYKMQLNRFFVLNEITDNLKYTIPIYKNMHVSFLQTIKKENLFFQDVYSKLKFVQKQYLLQSVFEKEKFISNLQRKNILQKEYEEQIQINSKSFDSIKKEVSINHFAEKEILTQKIEKQVDFEQNYVYKKEKFVSVDTVELENKIIKSVFKTLEEQFPQSYNTEKNSVISQQENFEQSEQIKKKGDVFSDTVFSQIDTEKLYEKVYEKIERAIRIERRKIGK